MAWSAAGKVCGLDVLYDPATVRTFWEAGEVKEAGGFVYVTESAFWRTSTGLESPKQEYGPILKPLNACARSCLLEFHARALLFSRGIGLTPRQTLLVTSIFAHIVKVAVRSRSKEGVFFGDLVSQQECFVVFRDLLLRGFRARELSSENCQQVTEFAVRGFFTHFKLYQYVCAWAMDTETIRACDSAIGSTRGGSCELGIEVDFFDADFGGLPPTVTYEVEVDGEKNTVVQKGCLRGAISAPEMQHGAGGLGEPSEKDRAKSSATRTESDRRRESGTLEPPGAVALSERGEEDWIATKVAEVQARIEKRLQPAHFVKTKIQR